MIAKGVVLAIDTPSNRLSVGALILARLQESPNLDIRSGKLAPASHLLDLRAGGPSTALRPEFKSGHASV